MPLPAASRPFTSMPQAGAAGVRLSLRSGGGHHMGLADGGRRLLEPLWDQFAGLADRPVTAVERRQVFDLQLDESHVRRSRRMT